MPIVMPVVVSQAAAANQAHRDLEENLVTRLMLDEAADVRLIGSLQQLQSSSTDQVMLERLTGDFILLSWQTPDESLQYLRALQIPARRAAHASDPNPPQEAGRRVYFIDLASVKSIDLLIQQLKACSTDRTTKTIQIGLSANAPKKAAPPTAGSSPLPTTPSPGAAPPTAPPSSPAAEVPPIAQPTAAIRPADDTDEPRDEVDDAMESLIDELDKMDL